MGQYTRKMLGLIGYYKYALLYWIFCGVIPFIYVLIYYYPKGIKFITLYGSLFIYPLFFSWITIILSTKIGKFFSSYVFSDGSLKKGFSLKKIFWTGIIIFSIFILGAELSSENVAPFEINKEFYELKQSTLVTGSKNIILIDYFDESRGNPGTQIRCNEREGNIDVRCQYQSLMMVGLKNRWFPTSGSYWSPTRYIYIVSFFIQSVALLYLFFAAVLILRYRLIVGIPNFSDYYAVVLQTGAALVVALFWVFLRVSFLEQKLSFFPDQQNLIAERMIVSLISVAFIFLLLSLWQQYKDVILALAGTIFGGGGLFVIFIYPEVFGQLFHREIVIESSFLSLIGLMVIGYGVFLLRHRA